MIVIFEGPEKAGKTTTIAALAELLRSRRYMVRTRKFSGPMKSYAQYFMPLLEDQADPSVVSLWDRGWVSEYVYSTFFVRNSPLRDAPNRTESLFTYIVDRYGLKYMVLPADPAELYKRRTADDLPIDPGIEYKMFFEYAARFGWMIVETAYNPVNLADNARGVLIDIERLAEKHERLKTHN